MTPGLHLFSLVEAAGGIARGKLTSVELVTDRLRGGWTVSQILDSYPHIRAEDVDACVKYKATGASLSRMSWDEYDARMANVEPLKS